MRLISVIRKIWQRLTQKTPRRSSCRGARVTDQDIEAARRVNLLALIESLGHKPSSNRGEKAMFYSPLRTEQNPSFSVSYYKGRWTWKDWGSGKSGDTISFVQNYHGIEFLNAVRKLNNGVSYATPSPAPAQRKSAYDADKVKWVRKLHKERLSVMTSGDHATIARYFGERRVRCYKEMACVTYTNFTEHKSFIAIPMPHPGIINGLECREFGGSFRQTLGHKCLWLMRRTSRIVVTESILDALAAEIVLNDFTLTLCSINGVGGVEKLGSLLEALKPQEALFALDNDEPGRAAQKTAMKVAKQHCGKIVGLDHCVRAGVKDMHKLLVSRSQTAQVAREQ